jgi:hypothetical protein
MMLQRSTNNPSRNVCDEAGVSATNNQATYDDDFALGDLNDSAFDDCYINEFLSTPCVLDTPMQHGYDSESRMSCSISSNNQTRTLKPPASIPTF